MAAKRDLVMFVDWELDTFPRHSRNASVSNLAAYMFFGFFLGPCLLLTVNNQSAILAILDIAVPRQYQTRGL